MTDINNKPKNSTCKPSFERLRSALDYAAERLENPIVLIDLSYNLLCSSSLAPVGDKLWDELVSLGSFSHETVDFFNCEKFIEAFAKADGIVILKSSQLKYDRASCAIYDNDGAQIGSICVVESARPFVENDFEVMKLITAEFASIMQQDIDNDCIPSKEEELLVQELIEGTLGHFETDLDCLYDGLGKNIYVAVIDIIQYENTLSHLEYFKNLFLRIRGDFKYFVYLSNIVVIFGTDFPTFSVKRDMPELDKFFSSYNIYAGISESFCNLSSLRTHFKQALSALNFGLGLFDGKNIYKFADFKLEAFLKKHPESLFDICHPTTLILHEHDKKHGTNYTHILYNYIFCSFDVQKTATRLESSEDEVSLSIAEIESMFDVDFDNANSLLTLYRSLRLTKYFPERFM